MALRAPRGACNNYYYLDYVYDMNSGLTLLLTEAYLLWKLVTGATYGVGAEVAWTAGHSWLSDVLDSGSF